MSSTSPDRSSPKDSTMGATTRRSTSFSCSSQIASIASQSAGGRERRWAGHQTVTGGARPPVGKAELGARVRHPVQGRQGDVGAHRGPSVGRRAHHLVHYLGHLQALQHRPGGGDVPEGEVARAVRLSRAGPTGGRRSPRQGRSNAARRYGACPPPGRTRPGSSTSCCPASFR